MNLNTQFLEAPLKKEEIHARIAYEKNLCSLNEHISRLQNVQRIRFLLKMDCKKKLLKNKKPRLSPEQRQDLYNKKKKGATFAQLSDEFNISISGAQNIVKKESLK